MSINSAPNYRTTTKYQSPPHFPNRVRSFTYPCNSDIVSSSRTIQPISNHYKVDNMNNRVKRQLSQNSSLGSTLSDLKSPLQNSTRKNSTDSENGDEKWMKLEAMTKLVNNLTQIADKLFASVKLQQISESKVNYSGCSEFEFRVERLRNVIQQQISRMKAFWCGEGSMKRSNSSTSSEDHYQIEQMRCNLREMFNRMKNVVDELIPPENSQQKLTKSWVEDLKCQLTGLEVSIKGIVKSISCDSFQSQTNSPLSEPMFESFNALRIKELEDDLEASTKREDDIKLKLKLLEERSEKKIEKMDEQINELQQLLERANTRADKSSDEAFILHHKLNQLEASAEMKQLAMGLSEQTIRRGDQVRSRAGYTRTSQEYVNKHRADVVEHGSEFEVKRSPVPTISRKENIYDQPKPIPVRCLRRMSSQRERTNSVTSQGSRLVSPKEIKRNTPWNSSIPESGYHYTGGNEYSRTRNFPNATVYC